MKLGFGTRRHGYRRLMASICLFVLALRPEARGQLVEKSLQAYRGRLVAGDPAVASTWEGGSEGPKGIAAGDLDGVSGPDIAVSNLDGTVTVFLNRGDGHFEDPPIHLHSGASTLREVIIAKLTPEDGRRLPDIAACAIGDGVLVIFPNLGAGKFGAPIRLATWKFARNVAAGDFDGDGITDLAVGGSGIGLRHYRGLPTGGFQAKGDLTDRFGTAEEYSKPVYVLKTTPALNGKGDLLVATHAELDVVYLLALGANGALEERSRVSAPEGAYDLDVGALTSREGGLPDLATAHRERGLVEIRKWLGTAQTGTGFEERPVQQFSVPGGPRAVQILDLDGDGWNDLLVVMRHLDRVLPFRNENGMLVPGGEMPVGRSPRDLAAADFNGDGQTDVAVINRLSNDVSILTAEPGQVGFSALNQMYLVDGEVVDLAVADFDGNGRKDVAQLHRASGDFSIRLSEPGGILGVPQYVPAGTHPTAMKAVDFYRDPDRHVDIVIARLGREGIERGSISIYANDGKGHFPAERRVELPPEVEGRPLALEVADLCCSGNGVPDIAASLTTGSMALFHGRGDGTAVFVREIPFAAGSLAVVAGDFDLDGDNDLAGTSLAGELVVIVNPGNLFFPDGPAPDRLVIPPLSNKEFGTRDLEAGDLDRDGDLDLVAGSGAGAILYRGGAGASFVRQPVALPGTAGTEASSLALADLNNDGWTDVALSCQLFSCVTLVTRNPARDLDTADAFSFKLSVDVPAGKLLAAGDVDGDGMADLVGTGSTLWTALSTRVPTTSGQPLRQGDRRRIEGPVINEFLASNNTIRVGPERKKWDWIEIFNGSLSGVDLGGYRLEIQRKDGLDAPWYSFPPGTHVPSGGYLLLFCTTSRKPFHTGFKLPIEGAVLRLLKPSGDEADRVDYPPQREEISFARYLDGLWSFTFNPIPTPGVPNIDNGPIAPLIRLEAVVPATWRPGEALASPIPGQPVRFYARGWDDVGILNVRVFLKSLGGPAGDLRWIALYDDGLHEDLAAGDGLFAELLPEGFPAGGGACVAAEVEDLGGEISVDPETADVGQYGDEEDLYCLSIGIDPPDVEFSELVSSNSSGLQDTWLGFPDWVEIANPTSRSISLGGMSLGQRFPADGGWLAFPEWLELKKGEKLVVFCDGQDSFIPPGPGAGVLEFHAPFELSAALGGDLVLAYTSPLAAAPILVDSVRYPPLGQDVAWARIGDGWELAQPTPRKSNPARAAWRGDVDDTGDLDKPGIDLTDPLLILEYLFLGEALPCVEAADTNNNGVVDLTDAIVLFFYLFMGGSDLVPGVVNCGN